jgi:cytochrome oxidase Cu insertion factor (SCO1/SenC/PrrC family)
MNVRLSNVKTPSNNMNVRSSQHCGVLIIIFMVVVAPLVAALIFYKNPQWWPQDASNYGMLISPQRELPSAAALSLTRLDGQRFDLSSLRGKWVLMTADGGACSDVCARKLFILRNTHASQGKSVNRLLRVWFITDDAPVAQRVLEAYRGTIMVRARPEQLAPFLLGYETERSAGAPAPDSTAVSNAVAASNPVLGSNPGSVSNSDAVQNLAAAPDSLAVSLAAPMWVLDPLGHLMLQFPVAAEPIRVRQDVSKLIYYSRIG